MMTNRPSFEKVDYTVRPGKNIERKMIAELLARLRGVTPLEDYRYVGLGATFFSDFILFHRTLGFDDMVSIEKEETRRGRVKFNVPFGCISVEFGDTNAVLPRLAWNKPTIIWLDYDQKVDYMKLDDITFLAQNMTSSSVVLATFSVHPNDFPLGQPPNLARRRQLISQSVNGRIPDAITVRNTANLPETCRYIFNAAIDQGLRDRNAALPPEAKIHYEQILYFQYNDGTPMVTVGGIVLASEHTRRYARAGFRRVPFYRPGSRSYKLEPPKLTLRERRYIDQQLPKGIGVTIECADILPEDLQEYSRLYRYFPWFVEAEL